MDQSTTARFSRILADALASRAFPCAALSVLVDGEEPFRAAAGQPDPESGGAELSGDELFDIASLTKPLGTSLVALKAVESGALRLDERLDSYLPESACARNGATVRQVMAHTAGFPAVPLLQSGVSDWRRIDRAESVSRLMGIGPENEPGLSVVYSCTGFLLLGVVLERLGGARLSELFDREVALPLGLSPGAEGLAGRAVALYRPAGDLAAGAVPTETCAWRGERVRGAVHDESSFCLGGDGGNAGLFANRAAVERLFDVWRDGGGLLRPETVEAARAPATAGLNRRRGLGIQLHDGDTCDDALWPSDAYGHTGFTGTCAWRAPGRPGVTVISLTNRVYFGRENTVDGIIAFRQALHRAVAEAAGLP